MQIEVIRATETWQRAGAYYVRVQGMARQHHISLQTEFDEGDTPDTKYIVLTDSDFPVATCRLFPIDHISAGIGRVVVLPEYRKKGLGRRVVTEAEQWLRELGFKRIILESRDTAVPFYTKLGYRLTDSSPVHVKPFDCFEMTKEL